MVLHLKIRLTNPNDNLLVSRDGLGNKLSSTEPNSSTEPLGFWPPNLCLVPGVKYTFDQSDSTNDKKIYFYDPANFDPNHQNLDPKYNTYEGTPGVDGKVTFEADGTNLFYNLMGHSGDSADSMYSAGPPHADRFQYVNVDMVDGKFTFTENFVMDRGVTYWFDSGNYPLAFTGESGKLTADVDWDDFRVTNPAEPPPYITRFTPWHSTPDTLYAYNKDDNPVIYTTVPVSMNVYYWFHVFKVFNWGVDGNIIDEREGFSWSGLKDFWNPSDRELTLFPDFRYIIDQSHPNNTNHQFVLSIDPDIYNPPSFSDERAVTTTGTAGTDGRTEFTYKAGTVRLYYMTASQVDFGGEAGPPHFRNLDMGQPSNSIFSLFYRDGFEWGGTRWQYITRPEEVWGSTLYNVTYKVSTMTPGAMVTTQITAFDHNYNYLDHAASDLTNTSSVDYATTLEVNLELSLVNVFQVHVAIFITYPEVYHITDYVATKSGGAISSHELDDWPFYSEVTQYNGNNNGSALMSPKILSTVNDNLANRTHHFKFTAQSVTDPAWVYFDLLPANVTFNITVQQDVFAVDDEIKKDLVLVKGGTYTFNHPDNATHPLEFISSSPDIPNYTVTQDGNNIVLTIPADSTTTNMTYDCENHPEMGGNIQVIEPAKTTYAYIDDAVLTHRLFVPNTGYLYPIGSIEMKFDSVGASTAYIMDIDFVDDGLLNFVPYWHIDDAMQPALAYLFKKSLRRLSKAINNCIRDLPIQQQLNFQTNLEIHAVPSTNTTILDPAGNVISGSFLGGYNNSWFMTLFLHASYVDDAEQIFAHEYYHAYHISLSAFAPSWFAEGLAEFFRAKYNREHLNNESAFYSRLSSGITGQIQDYLDNHEVDRFTETLLTDSPPNYNIRLYLILLLGAIHNPNVRQDASYFLDQLSYGSRNGLAEYQWLHSRNTWSVILKDFWHGVTNQVHFDHKFKMIFGQTVSTFLNLANAHMYAYPSTLYLFKVKIVNDAYEINGINQKLLTVVPTHTYYFDLSDASNETHNFVIKKNNEVYAPLQRVNNYVTYSFDDSTQTFTYGSESETVVGATISFKGFQNDNPLDLEDLSIHPDLLTNLPLYPDSNLLGREGNTPLLFTSFENDSEITIRLSPNARRFIFDIDEPVNTNVYFEIQWGTNFENTITTARVHLNNKGTYTIPFPQRHASNAGHALWTSDSKIVWKFQNTSATMPTIKFMAIQNDVAPTYSPSFTVLDSNVVIFEKSVQLQNNSKISFIGRIVPSDAAVAVVKFRLSNGTDNATFTAYLGSQEQVSHAYSDSSYTAAEYTSWTIESTAEVKLSYVDVLSMDYATQIWHDSAINNGNEIEMTGDAENCVILLPGNSQKVSFSDNGKISFKAKSLNNDTNTLKLQLYSTTTLDGGYFLWQHKLSKTFITSATFNFDTNQLSTDYQQFEISGIYGLTSRNSPSFLAQNVAIKDIVVHTRDDPGTADLKVQNATYNASEKKLYFTVKNIGTTKSIGRYIASQERAVEFYSILPVSTQQPDDWYNMTKRPLYANDQAFYHTGGITTWDSAWGDASFTNGSYIPYLVRHTLESDETNDLRWDLSHLQPGQYMLTLDFFTDTWSELTSWSYTKEHIDTYDNPSNNNFLFTIPEPQPEPEPEPEPTSTGQALGDPYVYPMRTPIPVKLPNRAAAYCLYQSEKTFINGEVRCATAEHQARMLQFVKNLGRETKRVIADGYFFSKFFVHDGSRDAQLMIDLRERTMEAQGDHAFAISESTHPTGSQDWGGVARNVLIEWPVDQTVMKLTVSFYTNPHIENGISLSVESLPANAFGLLVHNYKPKLMRLRSLTNTDTQIIQRLRKAQKITHLKDIKSRAEIWRR